MKPKDIARMITEDPDIVSTVLYHGTSKSNLSDISANGLDPSKSRYAGDEEDPYYFVYLSPSIRGARNFAPGGVYHPNKDPEEAVILAIRLPPELEDQLVIDRGEFIRAPFVIPPQFVGVIDET